jgi:hypothetical protein
MITNMTYVVDYSDADGKVTTEDFGRDLLRAKRRAARISLNPAICIAYVIANDGGTMDRGQIAYASGRIDHSEGQMS